MRIRYRNPDEDLRLFERRFLSQEDGHLIDSYIHLLYRTGRMQAPAWSNSAEEITKDISIANQLFNLPTEENRAGLVLRYCALEPTRRLDIATLLGLGKKNSQPLILEYLADPNQYREPGDRGVDHSRGQANVNNETSLHYGIVNQNDLSEGALFDVENEYDPHCPACGNELDDDEFEIVETDGECPQCHAEVERDDCFGDEPSRVIFDMDGAIGHIDSDGDLWVIESPWYQRGTYCSPCAPGAVSIGRRHQTLDESAPRAYALPLWAYREAERPSWGYVRRIDNDAPCPTSDAS